MAIKIECKCNYCGEIFYGIKKMLEFTDEEKSILRVYFKHLKEDPPTKCCDCYSCKTGSDVFAREWRKFRETELLYGSKERTILADDIVKQLEELGYNYGPKR